MKKEILQRRYELKYFPKIDKALRDRVSSLIEVIESRGVEAGFSYLSTQTDSGELSKIITDLYQKVGLRFARLQWSDLKEQERRAKKGRSQMQLKGFGFNPDWVQFLKDYLQKFLVDKILFKVAETTRKLLTTVLQDAIEKGWGIAETVRELRSDELTASQAARIARTEITRASNAGTYAAAESFPFEQVKEWIAAHDKRTRGQEKNPHASHVLLDGITIDYNEYFVDPVNGDMLLFPGDPGEPGRVVTAASTVNCRCSIAVVAKRDENGRLIPKK